MKIRSSFRAFPALLKVGFASAVAYRAELLVWVLSTTMPLIMLALFSAVARDAPIGRFGAAEFTAYFLATFVVRQLTGSWIVWQLNEEIRHGTLGMRLLRPIHPLMAYAGEAVASIPLRGMIALPLAFISLYFAGDKAYTHDPVMWGLWGLAVTGAWLLTLLTNFAIGILAFFIESSLKLMDLWLAFYFVLGGYVVPVELFPPWITNISLFLPFRYQLALPVEIMTGAISREEACVLLLGQLGQIAFALLLAGFMWRRGVGRFEAYGG